MRDLRLSAAVLLGALALSACGSTVQVRGTAVGAEALDGAAGSAVAQPGDATGGPADRSGAAAPGPAPQDAGTSTSPTDVGGEPGSGQRDGAVAGAGGPAARPSRGAAAPGATVGAPGRTTSASRGPVTVGLLITTASALESTGYSLGNTVDERAVDEALVKALNAEGGLAGRKIKAVYAETDVFSRDWETDFSAACARFTQDEDVDAVLGYAFNFSPSLERCLTKSGVPHLTTSFNIPGGAELAQHPRLVPLYVPTVERRALAKADGAIASGFLTRSNRLGILVDQCPGSVRSVEKVLLPFLRRAGLAAPVVYETGCVNGQGDSGRASSDLQAAQLAFASGRVDRVMVHGVSEGPGLAQFALTAESQGYRPGYIVSSLGNLALDNGTLPREQARNVRGFGWLPMEDVPVSDYGPRNKAQQRCLALLRSQRVVPSSTADHVFAWQTCEALFAYEAALVRTGGDADGGRVVQAVRTLGDSFTSVALGSAPLFTPQRRDPVVAARALTYREECGCWKYAGPARAIPDA